jgi:hypothetical protein
MPAPPVIAGPPFAIPLEVNVMGYWEREDGEVYYQGRVRVLGPNNEELGVGEQRLDFQGFRRLRARTTFRGFSIVGPGQYWYVSSSRPAGGEWTEHCRAPITVVYQ